MPIGDISHIHPCQREYSGIPSPLPMPPRLLRMNRDNLDVHARRSAVTYINEGWRRRLSAQEEPSRGAAAYISKIYTTGRPIAIGIADASAIARHGSSIGSWGNRGCSSRYPRSPQLSIPPTLSHSKWTLGIAKVISGVCRGCEMFEKREKTNAKESVKIVKKCQKIWQNCKKVPNNLPKSAKKSVESLRILPNMTKCGTDLCRSCAQVVWILREG